MGIIINKPALKVKVSTLLGKNIKGVKNLPKIYYGGPVELDKSFILHTNDHKNYDNDIQLDSELMRSNDFSTIEEIILGNGPTKSLLTIGYTGWASFQLHEELKKNDWLELDLDTSIIFTDNYQNKWDQAISKLGINKKLLKHAIFTNYTGLA